jgi:hypothetical protein
VRLESAVVVGQLGEGVLCHAREYDNPGPPRKSG